jgi:lysophospholipase L1-like esterase
MSDDTFKGRINQAVSLLKSLYPTKQIVLLTPLHRALANFGDRNLQPDESYQNSAGLYINDYIQATLETADVWGIPVINLSALSGLNPMVEEQVPYFINPETDRLHPNTAGHQRMAATLYYQLLTLPVQFGFGR